MKRLLTNQARLVCRHELGTVANYHRQAFVRISGCPVLVDDDPEGRTISGCPNVGATIKPCTRTLAVTRGYSDLLRIEGHRVCLDTVSGLTDGTPPGTVEYIVRDAGQDFVGEG